MLPQDRHGIDGKHYPYPTLDQYSDIGHCPHHCLKDVYQILFNRFPALECIHSFYQQEPVIMPGSKIRHIAETSGFGGIFIPENDPNLMNIANNPDLVK